MTKSHSQGDRHSGDGRPINGDIKKDGAGQANWGKAGEAQLNADSGVNDPNDPNYEESAKPKPQPHQRQSFEATAQEGVAKVVE
ncbi:hypothetical protein SARC_11565 [Sphaeroforma arctica JP610]|uniref:Hyaluronan/mRNA-binding protein domain-containing protein n=1 Tax=Sphaeroforma arctica JP610 TaxID=667725 RepID=A0A0L0FGK8_9EUKA|nr:hypothetical protein SARC_11565 [Sphaeroforma arctica JP610]KNC75919.1 hypothetical protein SARC_11565 [Sphaeroforma arctica JP610]|eukprot:XP_014149821.1 hypothetical protein SARC_11565 [Sphaeroforma arctica JP610]